MKVLLVTNAHHKALELKLSRTGIDRWFDAVVVSHDLEHPKESRSSGTGCTPCIRFNPPAPC